MKNEKYKGDSLLQKTYTEDFITGKKGKNTEQRECYYITNSHPAIITAEAFDKVQEEMLRRARLVRKEDGTVESSTSKYNGKYLLGNLLVCGYCEASYRRRTERGKVVWRCATRIEKGKEICSYSPTIDEKWIQNALGEKICENGVYDEVVVRNKFDWVFKELSLDYNTGSPVGNCDVWEDESANDTDQIVSISGDNTNGYTIRVVGRDKYLTSTGTGDGSNVRWDSLVSLGNTQLWKFNLVPNTTTAGLTDATGTVATNKYTTTAFQQNLDIVNVTSTRTISSVTPSGGACKIPNISVPFNQYSTKIKNMNSKFGTACKAFACAAIYSYYTQKLISPYWFPIQSDGSYNIQYGDPIGEITKNAYKCFEFVKVPTTALSSIKSTLEEGKPILICCSLSGATHWVAAYGYKNNCASKSDILVVDSVNLNKDVEYGTAKYQDGVTDLDLSESMRINLKNSSTYAIQSAWTINIWNN